MLLASLVTAFLLPTSSPLCVFTGHSSDIQYLYEKLTNHIKDRIALYSDGDISTCPLSTPPPSIEVSADSPFARLSALEATKRIAELVGSEDLKVHGLVIAIDERSPSSTAVMDCSSCTDIRDWSKGGATAIGKSGWMVRRFLAHTLFPTSAPSGSPSFITTEKILKTVTSETPRERAVDFSIKLISLALNSTVDEEGKRQRLVNNSKAAAYEAVSLTRRFAPRRRL